MTYSEKIKELHQLSISLLAEYRLLTKEVNNCLKNGCFADSSLIKAQNENLLEYAKVMAEYKSCLQDVVTGQASFSSPYPEEQKIIGTQKKKSK